MKRQTLHHQRPAAARRIAGHAQEDHILDPYHSQQKLSEPTVCPQCGAVYHNGRWQWASRSEAGLETLCSACRRINDKFPAGIITFHGSFGPQQSKEIVHLARYQEGSRKERASAELNHGYRPGYARHRHPDDRHSPAAPDRQSRQARLPRQPRGAF